MSSLPSVPCYRFHPHRLDFDQPLFSTIPRFPRLSDWGEIRHNKKFDCGSQNLFRRRFAVNAVTGDGDAYNISAQESQISAAADEGSWEGKSSQGGGPLSSSKILSQLKRYGASGVLSYGILNTAYYSTTFLLVWFYFSPAPGKMGYLASAQRFLKVMAMVWAGSQVTKLIRAAGALALAPFVDRGLSWFTERFKFKSRGKAFLAIVGFCLGLALILFFVVVLLSA